MAINLYAQDKHCHWCSSIAVKSGKVCCGVTGENISYDEGDIAHSCKNWKFEKHYSKDNM